MITLNSQEQFYYDELTYKFIKNNEILKISYNKGTPYILKRESVKKLLDSILHTYTKIYHIPDNFIITKKFYKIKNTTFENPYIYSILEYMLKKNINEIALGKSFLNNITQENLYQEALDHLENINIIEKTHNYLNIKTPDNKLYHKAPTYKFKQKPTNRYKHIIVKVYSNLYLEFKKFYDLSDSDRFLIDCFKNNFNIINYEEFKNEFDKNSYLDYEDFKNKNNINNFLKNKTTKVLNKNNGRLYFLPFYNTKKEWRKYTSFGNLDKIDITASHFYHFYLIIKAIKTKTFLNNEILSSESDKINNLLINKIDRYVTHNMLNKLESYLLTDKDFYYNFIDENEPLFDIFYTKDEIMKENRQKIKIDIISCLNSNKEWQYKNIKVLFAEFFGLDFVQLIDELNNVNDIYGYKNLGVYIQQIEGKILRQYIAEELRLQEIEVIYNFDEFLILDSNRTNEVYDICNNFYKKQLKLKVPIWKLK